MAGRTPPGATFEVARVARPRRGGSLTIALWVAVVVALVGVAFFGRNADPRTSSIDATASAASGPSGQAIVNLAPDAPEATVLDIPDAVDLRSPAVGPITLTTPRLVVSGLVLRRVDHLEIALEARNNRVIDQVSVDAWNADGGIRPDATPRFEVQFDIPYPRPNGTMWVVVTAYDSSGMPLGGDRRPFTVGPIVAADPIVSEPYAIVDAPPLDQKRCGPDISGWRCG